MSRPPPTSTLFPYTTLFRSRHLESIAAAYHAWYAAARIVPAPDHDGTKPQPQTVNYSRSEEHTSELQSRGHLVCRLLLEKKNKILSTKYRNVSYAENTPMNV